jgi:hypothetical protein
MQRLPCRSCFATTTIRANVPITSRQLPSISTGWRIFFRHKKINAGQKDPDDNNLYRNLPAVVLQNLSSGKTKFE